MTEATYKMPEPNPDVEQPRSAREDRPSSMRPRPVDYDWSQLPVHWYKDDPQLTHTINVLNLLLPEGETWFVRVFVKCLPYLSDNRELRMDIRGFMGQESNHANAHQELLDYLDAHDISTTAYTDFIEWLLRDQFGDNPFGVELRSKKLQRYWDTFRLGGVAALEHVTAFLGAWALNAERLDEEGVDQVMVDLLRWHGAEEVEHQSVALDILQDVSPRYHHVWRSAAYGIAFPMLFAAWIQGVRYLMQQDERVSEGPTWKTFFRRSREGYLPSLWNLAKSSRHLLNPNHDPRVTDAENMKKAVAQIEKSHGAHMI